jgi:cystathionine beta-lyase/cystathionine gamma-synthase
MGLPVYRSATFALDTAEEYADVLSGRVAGYTYSRIDNPTVDAFAAAVTALEAPDGGAAGQAFASGMAAISTVLLTLCRSGARVLSQPAMYGGTYSVLHDLLPRYGVHTDVVDTDDETAVRAALTPDTVCIYAETMANPTLAVADLPMLAAVAADAGIPLVVDSTFATPIVCRPRQHGAHLVVHAATKYLGGHSDATGGVVVGDPELVARIRKSRIDLGGAMAPDEAFLLHRGLATLPLRVRRQCATAGELAERLAEHPALRRVDHPGLPTHRHHKRAAELFEPGLFGAIVTLTVPGGRTGAAAFCNRLRLIEVATSLGGTRSKVSPVATTTHRQMDDAALAAADIDPGAVRLSVGLEDPADLLEDLFDALGGKTIS